MKILDRYVAKNFLFGYFIALFVLLGMFMTIDLFLNLDEFTELTDELSFGAFIMNIVRFYGVRCSLWYKDMAGMMIVVAAVFSLARMTRNNELIAVMASGTSLKRILAPILIISVILTGLMIADQEFVVPRFAYELTRDHDDLTYENTYSFEFIGDDNGSLISTQSYNENTQQMQHVLIILRESVPGQPGIFRVTGKIQADSAVYNPQRGGWDLVNGRRTLITPTGSDSAMLPYSEEVDFYTTHLSAMEIPIRKREGFKTLLSLRQLNELEDNPGARQTDLAALAFQKHTRITDPIINLIMLMVALPVLVCRDPKAMKSAILISFATTLSCFLVVFICKLFATEVFFGQTRPVLWTWLPIFIFFPVAIIEIDSMRT